MTHSALASSPATLSQQVRSASPALTSERKLDLSLEPAEQRRANPDFLARASISCLAERLPLPWPTPPETPPSPKPHYRSAYQPPSPARVLSLDQAAWALLNTFDLVLGLIDFSGLRPVLAASLYRVSALGRVPYDPISLFLLFGWQLVNRWSRLEVLRHLKEPRYADYALTFGFCQGCYPSESGYRYFLTTLGKQPLHDLLVQSMSLVKDSGLIPEQVQQEATVSFDGQIHDAASRLDCRSVQASCYQPSASDSSRPCPAKDKGQTGCACDTLECRSVCKRATPRDPEARFVWYAGHNHARDDREARPDHEPACPLTPAPPSQLAPSPSSSSSPSPSSKSAPTSQSQSQSQSKEAKPQAARLSGEGRYGYRSLACQLVDPLWRVNWTLDQAALLPANAREEEPAGSLLRQVVGEYPWLRVSSAVGDAGLGYEPFLGVAYDLDVRRVVDLRADPRTDNDQDAWAIRGYDDKGWPICQLGCRFHPNGFDWLRHRMKWCCRQACEVSPSGSGLDEGEPVACPPDCPFRDRAAHPLGRIVNVGRAFADGSLRLVRDVPYGSTAWKEVYRRGRNAAEGRNARLEEWGLKRLPVFGQPRSQATIFLADLWGNLLQLARLIKEATCASLPQTSQPSQAA